jgi:hypothetical protein
VRAPPALAWSGKRRGVLGGVNQPRPLDWSQFWAAVV